MRKIFISYRRSEAEYAAGALGRELRAHFGEHQVFRDKEDIGAGASWKKAVLTEIDRDSALLVLIGSQWTKAANAAGERRLDRADDPIVLEIADGLKDGASVIPVLLENSVMPSEADLPEPLRAMAEFNALRLRDSDWVNDVARVVKALESAGFVPVVSKATAPPMTAPALATKSGKVIASYVVGILSLLGYKETHDSEAFWGLAFFSMVALVLGVLAYRDYRKGFARSKWPSIGAMGLAGLFTLSYIAWALDPNVPAKPPEPAAANPTTPASLVTPTATPLITPAAAPAVANAKADATGPASNISGRWTDSNDGTAITMNQNGERIQMAAATQAIAMHGDGTLVGRQLEMTLKVSGMDIGTLRMTLDPTGKRLAGAMNVQGKVQLVTFQR